MELVGQRALWGRRVVLGVTVAALATAIVKLPAARRARHRLDRQARRFVNRSLGAATREDRMADADDVTLADRVRSSIGPLLKELDTPRVHVMAEGDRVMLHGVIVSDDARERLEHAVHHVAGVGSVASYLQVGLLPSDTRPSMGSHDLSLAASSFHDALASAGLTGRPAEIALAETVRLMTNAIPDGERAHVFAHLPADVKAMVGHDRCRSETTISDEKDLVARVRTASGLRTSESDLAVKTVVQTLRRLVPEECDDVTAVLPTGLKPLWADALRSA